MDVIYLIAQECLRRGYSPKTAQAYCYCVRRFMRSINKEPRRISRKDVQSHIDRLVARGACSATVNLNVCALKFLLEQILGKRVLLRIRYSKVPKRLPLVLSKDEVKRLIRAVENPGHKLMVELMYSAGLRVSELLNLKVCDLEIDRCFGWVRKGKGGKDRMFVIAKAIKMRLQEHILGRSDDSRLFDGRKGRNLDIRTPQEVVRRAAKKAGLQKPVHCHTLRHSFATHLIENGYDLMAVQHLMGHADADTTMVYIHTARPKMINVRSPYDEM